MSDLFAYHTLPLVRQRLGQQANRKQLRQEMEKLLVNMTDQEFALWMESFQNLKGGDTTMLKRRTPPSRSARHQGVLVTPAPLVSRSKLPGSTTLSEHDNVESKNSAAESCNTPTKPYAIKHETEPNSLIQEPAARVDSSKKEDRLGSAAARDSNPESGMVDLAHATIPTAGASTSVSSLPMVKLMSDSTDSLY